MASYTIEDIELIRRKSGISYQEAVALLDYHNGSVARALVDLERNGRLKDTSAPEMKKNTGFSATVNGKPVTKSSVMAFVHKCFRARVKVRREEIPILNVSVLFGILSLLVSPHLVVIGLIICLVMGYKISFDKHDHTFDGENLERTVRNAAENVRATVNDFTSSFQGNSASTPENEDSAEPRSYYSRPEPVHTAPVMNVPVQVESQDGNVTIHSDKDGYANATVE